MIGSPEPAELLQSGVIIIDKPPGLTSHEVTSLVKKMTGSLRTGHAGTLDPSVSGVLPIALGRATKLLDYIVAKDKVYICLMKFKNVQTKERILELFEKFTGGIIQTPPKISAVRKVPRKRFIHYIKFLEQDGRLVLFETKTQAGTYVRTLCTDIGKLCGGARMEELRRIAVGSITEDKAIKMEDLADALWLLNEKSNPSEFLKIVRPVEEYLTSYPKIFVKISAVDSLLNGAQLAASGISSMENFGKEERVALFSEEKQLIGMGNSLYPSEEIKKMQKGIVVKTERIHMLRH
ncbi:MAG: RNA-guided pseudouridylation complex pseudouridine synthase subunit Cbf5 [Candidatus ainarchaeum sp.]|nr:RNA-guided pseudouridylation complex pseudouridine synthase subunit Cbf5 [Candidatus ainarchaeum sp.]